MDIILEEINILIQEFLDSIKDNINNDLILNFENSKNHLFIKFNEEIIKYNKDHTFLKYNSELLEDIIFDLQNAYPKISNINSLNKTLKKFNSLPKLDIKSKKPKYTFIKGDTKTIMFKDFIRNFCINIEYLNNFCDRIQYKFTKEIELKNDILNNFKQQLISKEKNINKLTSDVNNLLKKNVELNNTIANLK